MDRMDRMDRMVVVGRVLRFVDKKRAEKREPLMGMPGVHRNDKSR
jgi:hypothetical protein